MAGYGYTYRDGYTTYNGVAPRIEGWSKTSYTSDHTCQPVFIDAEGRRKPVISYTPNGNTEYYVTTEVVKVPFVTGYKQSNPVRVEVLMREDSDVEGKWNRPSSPEKWPKSSSPVRYHAEEEWNKPSSPVRYHAEEKWNKPSSPVRYHVEEKWTKPSSPVRYHAEEKWKRPSSPRYDAEEKGNRPSSPVHERPQPVEDFITKIQTQASRPNKFGPPSATYWRQTPNPNSYHVNTGYDDQSGLSNKESQKPSNYNIKNEIRPEPWTKPSPGGWSKGQGANLSQPTSDINTAMEYLKEAVKPSSGIATPPSRYRETIDSREAERKYGSLNSASRPIDNYTRTIDSREAERKYGSLNSASRPIDNYTRTIDSREAERKYGSLNSASRPIDNYTRTIDSREAARKYGGTTV
ncbi:hypothetical protein REPUB_Repub06bG0031200 [Reevesia pubescens]